MPWEKMSSTLYRKLWKMSSDYDLWLDENLEDWYSDEDEAEEPEWDGPYPEDDYDEYD